VQLDTDRFAKSAHSTRHHRVLLWIALVRDLLQ
jgi:hypothetical protein